MDAEYFARYASYTKLNKDNNKDVEDFVDRLNYRYTSVILAIMTGIVGMRQYVGKQIECWIPQEFTKGWEDYAESYCFVSSTYFHKLSQRLTKSLSSSSISTANSIDQPRLSISYYQWAPIFLLTQILICSLPHCFLKLLLSRCNDGLHYRHILSVATQCNVILPKELTRHAGIISNYLQYYLDKRYQSNTLITTNTLTTINSKGRCCFKSNIQRGRKLFTLFITIKVLSLIEVCGQILIMETFIGARYYLYGVRILYDYSQGQQWDYLGHFPRVTFCDFEAKKIGKNDPYTLQCVLPLNMFLEKIFIFLWLWFALMSLLTVISIFYWLILMRASSLRLNFIETHLSSYNIIHQLPAASQFEDILPTTQTKENNDTTSYQLHLLEFSRNYLQVDSVFLFHILTMQCGSDMLVTEILSKLWIHYLQQKYSIALSGYSQTTKFEQLDPTFPTHTSFDIRNNRVANAPPMNSNQSYPRNGADVNNECKSHVISNDNNTDLSESNNNMSHKLSDEFIV